MSILTKIAGDPHHRVLKRLHSTVDEINSLEPEFEALTDQQLRDKTAEFKHRLGDDEKGGESLDDLLPEAFAAVREAAKRTIGQRHFDVQLLGGIVLHQGRIAEMKTGEGKTLVATTALYLNALLGEGCHLVTVNDYLVRRDCGWMGRIFDALGMTTSAIAGDITLIFDREYVDETAGDDRLKHLRPIDRKQAYQCDITYGTNSEFGFDYLRDNLALDLEDTVQRGHYLRHRGRGRQYSHRRGANAADHQRRGGRVIRDVSPLRPTGAAVERARPITPWTPRRAPFRLLTTASPRWNG